MPYITLRAPQGWYQISFDDILSGRLSAIQMMDFSKQANTRTHYVNEVNKKFVSQYDIKGMIKALESFNQGTKDFQYDKIAGWYNTFYIEKSGKGMPYIFKNVFSSQKRYVECDSSEVCRTVSGYIRPILSTHSTIHDDELKDRAMSNCVDYLSNNGFSTSKEKLNEIFKSAYRRIDAPKDELKSALRRLKAIFEDQMFAMHHTAAFAYVRNRCTVDAVKRHQKNDSHWFLKIDFSDFFGSTNKDYVMRMISKIFPFSEIVKDPYGSWQLDMAISLCFLHGGLPQGTPISPMLTNLMMIPIDHYLANQLKNYDGKTYVYTRYADDILISCKYDFNPKEVMDFVNGALKKFDAPFSFKEEKTRYGSRSGRNWNLGVMLNKDNEITIGHENKQRFRAMVSNYAMDCKNCNVRDLHEIQVLSGLISYYKMVEKDYVEAIIEKYNAKYGLNILDCIRNDMSAYSAKAEL